jgi:hypothetical protein
MTDSDPELTHLLLDETGQVWAYASLEDLISDIESYDVEDGIYRAWHISGRHIELTVTDPARELVEGHVTDTDESQRMRAALEDWIRVADEQADGPARDPQLLSTAALAQEAHRLQQPPPSLVERLRDRWGRRST